MSLSRVRSSQPELDLVRAFSQGPRVLRRNWAVATLVGETVGFLLVAVVAVFAFELYPMFTMSVMVLAGAVEGLILGAAQAQVLGREFFGFHRPAWVGATSLGAAAAWFIGMLPSSFHPLWKGWSPWVTVPIGVLLAAGLLASIGLAQWTVLRHHVARSRTWMPVNAAAWLLGLGVLAAITTPLWREGQSAVTVVLVAGVGGLAMASVVALVTGAWLAHLVRPRRRRLRPVPVGVPAGDWHELAESTDGFRVFDAALTEELPDPVRRWLVHAISPGTSLLTGVHVEAHGHVRLGRDWRVFVSRQRARLEDGFVWAATARLGPVPITGFDRYTHGTGQMCWRALRRIRVMSQSGDEVTRSARGRHVAEILVAAPAAALDPGVRWEPVDYRHAIAHLSVDGVEHSVTVDVDPVGRLRQVEMDRWGTPPGRPFGNYRFGAVLGEERRYDGYLVPTEIVTGWHFGTDRWAEGVFLRARVMRCSFH